MTEPIRNLCAECYDYHNNACRHGFDTSNNNLLVWDVIGDNAIGMFESVVDGAVSLKPVALIIRIEEGYLVDVYFKSTLFPLDYKDRANTFAEAKQIAEAKFAEYKQIVCSHILTNQIAREAKDGTDDAK